MDSGTRDPRTCGDPMFYGILEEFYILHGVHICDYLSENPSVCITSKFLFIFSAFLHSLRNGSPKFQSSMVSGFGITALESRKSKETDLYSDYTKNKLQVLT